jgi:hypothetical protein
MAIAAEVFSVAHAAEVGRLIGGLPMLLAKVEGVIEILIGDMLTPGVVTFGADRSTLAEFRFRWMLRWRGVTRFYSTAGGQKGESG